MNYSQNIVNVILAGGLSRAWKKLCYRGHALNKETENLFVKEI